MARCGVPWGICPNCQGPAIEPSDPWDRAADRVSCLRCLRKWPRAEVEPCPWPATTTLIDASGRTLHVCAAHASAPGASATERRADGAATMQAFTCEHCHRTLRAFSGGVVAARELHAGECTAPAEPDGENPDVAGGNLERP